MTFAQLTTTSTLPASSPLAQFLWTLPEQTSGEKTRDLDGALLMPGTLVLGNPIAPDEIYEATESRRRRFIELGFAWTKATRQRIWLDSNDVPVSGAALCRQFSQIVGRNISEGVGQRMPWVRASIASGLLPMRVRIRRVSKAADLSLDVIDQFLARAGLPLDCAPAPKVRSDLQLINSVEVFRIDGPLGQHMHAVVAYLSPVTFRLNSPVTIDPITVAHLDMLRQVYAQWLSARGIRSGSFCYFSVGGAAFDSALQPNAAADAVWVFNQPTKAGEWKMTAPLQLTERAAVRDFLDRLKPEARDQRAAHLASLIAQRLAGGFRGNITQEWLVDASGYQRGTVRAAMFDLQDRGTHRLSYTEAGLLSIAPIGPGEKGNTAKIHRRDARGRHYHFHQFLITSITTSLLIAAAYLRNEFIHGVVVAAPLAWLTALVHRYWTEIISHKE